MHYVQNKPIEERCFAKIKRYTVALSCLIINQEGQSVKQVPINPHSYLSAKAVAHLERAFWVKCTTLLCFSLMQYSSGDETSRWESSEPERTCWLTATLDTLARACTQTRIEPHAHKHAKRELFQWRIPLTNTLIPPNTDQDDTWNWNAVNAPIKDRQLVILKRN